MHRFIDSMSNMGNMRDRDERARQWKSQRAFTLLELILSVALTGMLAVAAFTLTNGAVQMGAEVGEDQQRNLEIQRCMEVFRSHLESLPGSARFELLAQDAGQGIGADTDSLSELRIYDVPEAFRVGGGLGGVGWLHSDAVSIISEEVDVAVDVEIEEGREDQNIMLSLRYDTFGEREDEVKSRYLTLMGGAHCRGMAFL